MTQGDKEILEILRYFNENRNGTNHKGLRDKFKYINDDDFQNRWNALKIMGLISSGDLLKITEKGESELNKLQSQLDLEKALKVSSKSLDTSKIVAIVTCIALVIQCYLAYKQHDDSVTQGILTSKHDSLIEEQLNILKQVYLQNNKQEEKQSKIYPIYLKLEKNDTLLSKKK